MAERRNGVMTMPRTIDFDNSSNSLTGEGYSYVIRFMGGHDQFMADRLYEGADTVFGGVGHDTIVARLGDDLLFGGYGEDFLAGGFGADFLHGGRGDDRLSGDNGNDRLFGGFGADLVRGGMGNDTIRGGANADTLYGGDGADTVRGNAGNDRIFGGQNSDRIVGGSGADRLFGGNADDRIFGGAGHDIVHGDSGDDRLFGRGNDDTLFGGNGDDRLFGGKGNDALTSSHGNNQMRGGPGADTFNVTGGNTTIHDFDGRFDTFLFEGAQLSEFFVSYDGTQLLAQDGQVRGNITQNGDDVTFSDDSTTVELLNAQPSDFGIAVVEFGSDVTFGTNWDDTLSGSFENEAEQIYGLGGNDDFFGGSRDYLNGGSGRDTFFVNQFNVIIADFEIGIDLLGFQVANSAAIGWATTNLSEFSIHLSGVNFSRFNYGYIYFDSNGNENGVTGSFARFFETEDGINIQNFGSQGSLHLDGITLADLIAATSGSQLEVLYGSRESDVFVFDLDQSDVEEIRVENFNADDSLLFVTTDADLFNDFYNQYRADSALGNGDLLSGLESNDVDGPFGQGDFDEFAIIDVEVIGNDTHVMMSQGNFVLEDYIGPIPSLGFVDPGMF